MSETNTATPQKIAQLEEFPYKDTLPATDKDEAVKELLGEIPEHEAFRPLGDLLGLNPKEPGTVDPGVLQGISLEVNNRIHPKATSFATPEGIAGSKKYVIREVEILQKRGEKLEKTFLPDSPEGVAERIPLVYTRGGIYDFGRRTEIKEAAKPDYQFVIDKYNSDGQLEDIVLKDLKEMVEFIEKAAISEVSREEEPEDSGPAHAAREVDLHTNPHGKETFNEISEQLEPLGIYNWTGLSWDEVKERKMTAKEKREHLESIQRKRGQGSKTKPIKLPTDEVIARAGLVNASLQGAIFRHKDEIDSLEVEEGDIESREVLKDTVLVKKVGSRTIPIRTLLVKETIHATLDNPITTQKLTLLRGPEIRPYLELHKKQKKEMRNVRLVQTEVPAPAYEAGLDEQEMEERTRAHLEAFIEPQMTEHSELDSDEKLALWLLSSSDIRNHEDEDGRTERQKRLDAIRKSPVGRQRIAVVRELIHTHGAAKVYALAKNVRDDFVTAADSLTLPTKFNNIHETGEIAADSMSWALEDLADLHYIAQRHKADPEDEDSEVTDPFDETIASVRQRRDIVAKQLALSLISEAIDRDIVSKPQLNKDGEVVKVPEEVFGFNPDALDKIPELDKDIGIALTEKIVKRIAQKQPMLRADLVHLGNELQRGIGR